MRIIIDAMSGDKAPEEIVKGAVDAQREFEVDITLVGREEDVRRCLVSCGADGNEKIAVVHAPDVIDMCDDPSTAVRRKDGSSMAVALRLVQEGEGDACISAGSTGALLSGATLTVKRIRGIRRACLAPVIPNGGRGAVIIDCGANSECTPEYLLQFALMGSFYSERILGCGSPRVGLLNNGSEPGKGTELQKSVYPLLEKASGDGIINFVGNIEPTELFSDRADVVVSDGFSGNILIKTVEGSAKFLMKNIKNVFAGSLRGKMAYLLIRNDMKAVRSLLDASEIGGTALLGISKPVLKAHGGSDARAIRSAVRQAIAFVDEGVVDAITQNVDYMKLAYDGGRGEQ